MTTISSVLVLFCTTIAILAPAFAGDYLPSKPPVPPSSGPYISPLLYQLAENLDLTRKTSQKTYLQMLEGLTPAELYPSFAAIASLPPILPCPLRSGHSVANPLRGALSGQTAFGSAPDHGRGKPPTGHNCAAQSNPQPKLYAQALARSLQQFPNPKINSALHSFSPQHPHFALATLVLSFLP